VARGYREKGNHIISAKTEHLAVLDPCEALEREGFQITYLPVDSSGRVDPEDVRRAIKKETILISLMTANNEIGTIQPIAEIGKIAKEKGVLFHTDAAQAIGKIFFHVEEMGVDLVSISAHKIYGPKGIGGLYVRGKNPRVQLQPIILGGGHEKGMRSGTLNVPGIVGLGAALKIARHEMKAEVVKLQHLRDKLFQKISDHLKEVVLNGHPTERLPNNLNLSFPGIKSEAIMMEMKEVSVSSASACTTAVPRPSHVLQAIGLSDGLARSSIRFGLGRFNTGEEVEYVAQKLGEVVDKLRGMA
jgi:cysteine desulfurase